MLIRIENDGSEGIARDDYDGPESDEGFGLTAVFSNRTVSSVSVPLTHRSHRAPQRPCRPQESSYEGRTPTIPSVPYPGEFFKLGGALRRCRRRRIELTGGLSGGEVHRNRSTTLDAKPPLFSGVSRTITILLTASVLMLAGIVFFEEIWPHRMRGLNLTVTGSTAFEPVLKEVAEEYQRDCAEAGPEIDVDPHGSTAGIRELVAAGREAKEGSPPMVALSDGPKPDGLPELRENPVAVSLFTLVVNKGVGVKNLSTGARTASYRARSRTGANSAGATCRYAWCGRQLRYAAGSAASVLGAGGDRQLIGRLPDQGRLHGTGPALRTRLDGPGVADRRRTSRFARVQRVQPGRRPGRDQAQPGRRVPSVDDLQHGDHTYSFREIEYAYTYGQPPTNSLASSFLMTLTRTVGQGVIRTHGHLPCHSPGVERLCHPDSEPRRAGEHSPRLRRPLPGHVRAGGPGRGRQAAVGCRPLGAARAAGAPWMPGASWVRNHHPVRRLDPHQAPRPPRTAAAPTGTARSPRSACSVGPSTSRTTPDAQSNWNAWSRRPTA
ncbi:hypothetical protein SHIRM173S_08338 [Streptomyces hirsutus]